MYKNAVITILCFMAFMACSNPEQEQLETLQSDVLAIHDEIMPQMGQLSELKTSLSEKNEDLKVTGDSTVTDQVIVNELVITNLDLAHEKMMGWMRQFQKVDLSGDVEANKAYLEDQLQKIQAVEEEMNNAIQSAQNALEE